MNVVSLHDNTKSTTKIHAHENLPYTYTARVHMYHEVCGGLIKHKAKLIYTVITATGINSYDSSLINIMDLSYTLQDFFLHTKCVDCTCTGSHKNMCGFIIN